MQTWLQVQQLRHSTLCDRTATASSFNAGHAGRTDGRTDGGCRRATQEVRQANAQKYTFKTKSHSQNRVRCSEGVSLSLPPFQLLQLPASLSHSCTSLSFSLPPSLPLSLSRSLAGSHLKGGKISLSHKQTADCWTAQGGLQRGERASKRQRGGRQQSQPSVYILNISTHRAHRPNTRSVG